MSGIIRVKKNNKYFVASNEPFNDKALSFGARGLMGYLLSKPDDWQVMNIDLYQQSPDGQSKVQRYLKEIKDAGYLRRYRVSDGKGKISWVSEIYENKELNPDFTKCQNTNIENSNVENTTFEKQPHIISTESIITESVNTNQKEANASVGPKTIVKDKFCEITSLVMPGLKSESGFWWSKFGELLKIGEGDADRTIKIMFEVVTYMRERELSITGPQSIIGLCRSVAANHRLNGKVEGTVIRTKDGGYYL